MTNRVHCKSEACDVYIGRPSKWGNPFSHVPSKHPVKYVSDRQQAVEKYREWIVEGEGRDLLRDIYELRDKNLGCYCASGELCHGDVLADLANMKKVAIVGCRDKDGKEWDDFQFLVNKMIDMFENLDYAVISGGARGADKLAKEWCKSYTAGKVYIEYPADWNKYGRQAGILRNTEIIRAADEVVAFWDGKSTGTRDSIRKAQQLKKDTHIFYI